ALDAGNPAAPGSSGTACEAMDQRGVVRPQGGACDIGAVEAGGAPTTSFCSQVPRADCKVALSGKATVVIEDRPGDAEESVRWKSRSGGSTGKADFGSPAATTDYDVCVYAQSGGLPVLSMDRAAPAGGACAGRPCWEENSRGFQYGDSELTPDGVAMLRLR